MQPALSGYPNISKFLSKGIKHKDTFLHARLDDTPDYKFWPHLEYFFLKMQRFGNYESIIERLSLVAPLKMGIDEAWEKWRQFRSAQSEITAIFIIENYLKGQVLEIIPINKRKPTPDIKVRLSNNEYLIEIKAQSGQQRGSKHPMAKGSNLFSPDNELDLKSWLFEERISSRNGRPMEPKTLKADKQGAAILFAMTDIMTMRDIKGQVSLICPDNEFIEKMELSVDTLDPFAAHFYNATFPVKSGLINLKELWLFNESHLDRFLVLSSETILSNHLKNIR